MTTDAGRWDRVKAVFQAALDRRPDARAAFLDAACGDDRPLRAEVDSLLVAHEAAGSFAEQPAIAAAAQGLTLPSFVTITGRQIGPYQIRALLGAGGMGDVYRARDTKLGRDVAIKILPRLFTSDPERLARFEREARVLASLNHPHIGAIYGLDAVDGTPALVLELVEGEVLANRIARGPVPVADALTIAKQVAEALEAAHERGLIHRDLKPANIKITPAGVVKVLDFGLAKAASGNAAGLDLTQSPTITVGGTAEGVILGTAAYMSPEQARGQAVDKGTDIWAFGCVLYEMLTQRAAFTGDTVADTIARILTREPDWSAIPLTAPANVRRVLHRCLQKDPKARLHDIVDARLDLEDIPDDTSEDARRRPRPLRAERIVWVSALALVVLIAVVGLAWMRRAAPEVPPPPEVRFEMTSPPTREPASLAMSPDGQKIVFAGTVQGRTQLWLRTADAVSPRPLAGTDGVAGTPFWSPDSRSVAFMADTKLKRIDVDGGTVLPLADAPGWVGGSWNRDGTILFVPVPRSPVLRVTDSGGEPVVVLSPTESDPSPLYPRFLPDGRHFLYAGGTTTAPGIYVGQLDRPVTRRLLDATYADYTPLGYLLFVRDRTLFAQHFDPARLELSGTPFRVVDEVLSFSASGEGSLVYRSGQQPDPQLVWFDRAGREMGRVSGSAWTPSISPDGSRVAAVRGGVGISARAQDVWVLLDPARDTFTRLTYGPGSHNSPVWSPDGTRVAYAGIATKAMFEKLATGGGAETLLLKSPETVVIPNDWSPDGRFLLYRPSGPKTGFDLWALALKDGHTFPVVQTDFDEREAQFSPDGRWFAYQSNESGRFEIYIRPFPDAERNRYGPVSSNGGAQVRWRRDGKELFYLGLESTLMAVPIQLPAGAEPIKAGAPTRLFRTPVTGVGFGVRVQEYAVSPGGNRFLINTVEEVASPITVIRNWKPKQ